MTGDEDDARAKLEQLFWACDTKGTGHLRRDDLREICAGLGIAAADSDTLFADLDHDRDSKIDFDDFAKGFREFVSAPATDGSFETPAEAKPDEPSTATKRSIISARRHPTIPAKRSEQQQQHPPLPSAWKEYLEQIASTTATSLNTKKLEDWQGIFQVLSTSPQLATGLEDIVTTLLQDVQRLQQDNERLETIYKTEKEKHECHLRQIEEEIDSHVSKVEAKIKQQMREEAEAEKQVLKVKMDEEISELQTHLKLFQTFDAIIKKDQGEKDRLRMMQNKLEEAALENRKLKLNLTDTQTSLALLHTEMAQLRSQYEEKCLELHSERESAYEYLHEQDHFSRQLNLLHEANKRLQDVNDSILSVMETNNNNSPNKQQVPTAKTRRVSCKRGSVIGDYLQDGDGQTIRLVETTAASNQRLKMPLSPVETEVDSLYESMNDPSPQMPSPAGRTIPRGDVLQEEELNYGIRRLMEDLDQIAQNDANLTSNKAATENGAEDHGRQTQTETGTRLHKPSVTIKTSAAQQAEEFEEVDLSSPTPYLMRGHTFPATAVDGLHNSTYGNRYYSLPRMSSRQSVEKVPVSRKTSAANALDYFEPLGPPDRMYKVVFAGDAAVGKTTFIMHISMGKFVPTMTSTLGVDFHVKTLRVDDKNVTLQLWDTAGQERFRSVTKSYFRRADGVMLLYDCTSEYSFLHVREWMETINEVSEKRVPVMLCANKTDLRETALLGGKSIVQTDDGERLAREFSAIFIETSAKSGKNMADALVQLTREMASNEDWEVHTSGLRVTNTSIAKRNSFCCKT